VADYDTNVLERLARGVASADLEAMSFPKRDGGFTEIAWERPA
jgi:hypothetical protein